MTPLFARGSVYSPSSRPTPLSPQTDLRERLDQLLGRDYRVERELGGGGMARVFVAEEIALGRKVVVKVLEPALAEGLSAERFAREARLAARLQDPHIVPVLAAGGVGELPYYTMPFVDGESLRARMARPVTTAEAVSILRDIALALEYAHAHDVAHRDIKPENVLLAGRTAVVTDFGIAKALAAANTTAGAGNTLTQLGTSLGTPAYMPPEQAVGDVADHRADIYSWGVVAYELLAGRHPFADKTSAQLIAAHIAEKPAPLATVRSDLPPRLASLVMQSLEKDPAERPQSARALVAVLDDAASIPSVQPSGVRRYGMLATAAVVVAVAVGGWFLTRRSAPAPNTDPALIAVLPFRISSGDASLAYLREGMLDLIAAKLVRSPRTVDQRTILAAWRSAGGGPTTDPGRAAAARLAAGLGAGRVIEGDIVGSSDRLTLTATFAEAPNGNQRAKATATGAASQVAVLVDSVIAELLVVAAGQRDRIAPLASTPLAALEAYLAGQADYRAGNYGRAVEGFTEALRIDSTFALAGLGLYMAAGWTLDPREDRGREIALQHPERLGARDRLLLGPTDPDSVATSYAQAVSRRENAVAIAPDSPDLWYRLGDTQFHYGAGVTSEAESWRRSLNALERGLALDSSYAPLLEHLPLIYRSFGDTARERVAIARLMRDTAAYYYPANRVLYAPDSASRIAAIRDIESKPFLAAYTMVVSLLSAIDVWYADDLLRRAYERSAMAADRDFVVHMQYLYAMESGQPSRVARYLPELPDRQAERMFAATFWDGDSTAGARQYAEVKPQISAAPPSAPDRRAAWVTAIFDAAQYELARGDTTHVARVIAQLRALPQVPSNPVETARPARLALILDAQFAALAGRSDAPQRLSSLDSLMRLGPAGPHVRLVGNLVDSRLLERSGDVKRAYEAVKRWTITTGSIDASLYATYLREQGRLGALANNREGAISAYRRYLSLRAKHEPSLDRDYATVKTELEKLERQSGGR